MNFVQTLTAVEKSRALSCAIRFLLAAILSGSQIFGAYAPFGLGFVAAAGAGMEGLSALLGLLVGALLMMPFTAAIKYIAAAILIFSVSVAFFDTKLYRKHAFLPLITAACASQPPRARTPRAYIIGTAGAAGFAGRQKEIEAQ